MSYDQYVAEKLVPREGMPDNGLRVKVLQCPREESARVLSLLGLYRATIAEMDEFYRNTARPPRELAPLPQDHDAVIYLVRGERQRTERLQRQRDSGVGEDPRPGEKLAVGILIKDERTGNYRNDGNVWMSLSHSLGRQGSRDGFPDEWEQKSDPYLALNLYVDTWNPPGNNMPNDRRRTVERDALFDFLILHGFHEQRTDELLVIQ